MAAKNPILCGPTVVLRHAVPDGSEHYDWLVDLPPGSGDRVPTFRCPSRPDRAPPSGFSAERLDDHRRIYLDYEGEISGGRGRVERVGSGKAELLTGDLETSCVLRMTTGAGTTVLEGRRTAGAAWRFIRAADGNR